MPLSTKNQKVLARKTYYQAFLQLLLRSRCHTVLYEELQCSNKSPFLSLLGKILAQDTWRRKEIKFSFMLQGLVQNQFKLHVKLHTC